MKHIVLLAWLMLAVPFLLAWALRLQDAYYYDYAKVCIAIAMGGAVVLFVL